MLLKEIKNIFHIELDEIYGTDEVTSFFYLLIENLLNLERFILAIEPNITISKTNETQMFAALSRLRLHEPIQYILGQTEFMNLVFKVNKNVLVPRPETEDLVRWVLEDSTLLKPFYILDIGTGSGCIAIAIAKHLPNTKILALDISKEALQIASENANANKVSIQFLEKNIFETDDLAIKFDIIISNPPYVREKEKNQMQQHVLEGEPDTALFVPDDDPLLFYKKITDFASNNLKNNGALYFEINQYLGKETKAVLSHHKFSKIELRKDIFGNDRMLKGTFKL